MPTHLATAALVDLRTLARWSTLCALTGVLAGLAAAVLVVAVDVLQAATLHDLLGLKLHERPFLAAPSGPPAPIWLLPLIPAAGGLAVAFLAWLCGPEVYGGGTDYILTAYHRRAGRIHWTVPIGKWVASAITLGTGGSAGREGPMTLIGGGIGSSLATFLRIGDRERRLLLLAGAGAGVGAVFRIPLGSAIFAIELLYRDGFEEEGIFPCLIASVSGYAVFIAFHGVGQLFALPPLPPLQLTALPFYALVGVACTPVAYLFTNTLRWVPQLLTRTRVARWLQPCVGGLLVGLLGILNPELLGIGYGWVQTVLTPVGETIPSIGLAGVLILFALGKILATSITVGSGGSGGTFAPSIVAGGFVGGAVGQVVRNFFPWAAVEPATYALVGMGAFLGGIAHVPLAAVIIVCELAGNYELLVPLMAAVGMSYLLLRRTTLYPQQVRNPATSPARAGGIAADALDTLMVADIDPLRPAPAPVPAHMSLSELIGVMGDRRASMLPVLGDDGKVREMVTLKTLRSILDNSTICTHLIVADATIPVVSARRTDSLQRVLESLARADCEELLVLNDIDEVIGVVGHADVARLALRDAIRQKSERD